MNIILIILVFGVIVFFHEFGHFIVAKMNKIAVMEFSIGMGPAIFSIQKKETKYSLRLLPIAAADCFLVRVGFLYRLFSGFFVAFNQIFLFVNHNINRTVI